MEDANKDQGHRKFSWICKLLSKIYPQLQPYSKNLERTEGQERVEMGKRTSRGIRRTQREDYESTGPLFTKKGGKFRVETDASGHAIRGVLSQEQDGKWRPIAFLSRTMQAAERNYEIYNKELLAIVEALAKWRQYLLDAAEPFEVWTDHENLKYFRKPHKLNGWQA